MTVNQVWKAIDEGKTVHWENELYIVTVEDVIPENEYQANHFTNRAGKVLRVTCTSNYFGSLLNASCLGKLYVK